jgi:hypothetical protein
MATPLTMEQIIHKRVFDLVSDWPIRFHSLEKVNRFASKCTSSKPSSLASLALHPVPGQSFDVESNIEALLRIISPENSSISRIPDHATPLLQQRVLSDFLGGTITDPYTAWISYYHTEWMAYPQRPISAMVFLHDMGNNHFFIHARMLSTSVERHIMATLTQNRFHLKAMITIHNNFFTEDSHSLCKLLQNTNENKCFLYFDVMKLPSGHFESTLNDAALWPQLLLAAAQSMQLELIHVTNPSEREQHTIKKRTMENIICIFRTEPHGDLILVTSHLFNVVEKIIPFAAGGRIIWRIRVN